MKKARIIFNDVEKIVEITEDFYTQYRVLGEMSEIWEEESHMTTFHSKKNDPLSKFMEVILSEEEPVDIAFDKMSDEYAESLMNIIESAFKVKVNKEKFYSDSHIITEEDKNNNIVIFEVGYDK